MRRILLVLPLVLLFSLTAKAQLGARFDGVVLSNTGTPVAGAIVQVCTQPATGTPCSPLANVYSDVNLTISALNPLTTDMNGNYFGYVAGGRYTLEFYGAGLTDKQLPDQTITLPLTSTPTFTSITLDGSTSGAIVLQAAAVAGSNTVTFQDLSGNVLLDTATQNVSGKTFAQNIIPDAAGTRTIGTALLPYSNVYIGGVATNNINLTGTATASRTATLPDNSGTIGELNLAQTWTAAQTFPSASLTPGELSSGTNGQCVITSGGVTVWGTCTGVTGANVSLSNLSGVAVNASLVPGTAGNLNLGSQPLPWQDLFLGVVANKALDFNVAGLTTNRTDSWQDASGTVALINVAQTFSQTQTFSGQIDSTVSTGTAPFSVSSTTLVPNLNVDVLNGVTISGTPASGEVPIASSGTAAAWGTPSPTPSILVFCSTSLSSTVSVTASTLTAMGSVNCTIPSSGCPCRVLVSFGFYKSGGTAYDYYVSDGLGHSWIPGEGLTASSRSILVGSGLSPTTYANSAGTITFTAYIFDTGSSTIEPTPQVGGGGPNSLIQAAIYSSN